jgi:sarcosine oxidase subunit alpha
MSQTRRLAAGGRIDRSVPLSFSFDGATYEGFAGDTLASALLANGVEVVGYGIETGRPRGIFSAGSEEPNALVEVRTGGHTEILLRATQVELVDGLAARSLGGRGRLPPVESNDPGRFDHRYVHCDVLVVGAGPAGLSATLAAGRTDARVILADEQVELGGTLLASPATRIDGRSGLEWVGGAVDELDRLPEVRLLARTTAVGYHDHNFVILAQRSPMPGVGGRLWHVPAKQVVLATGAHERSMAFADNDRPGVMLAGAARTYIHRFGVRPGDRAVVFANHDVALATAEDLRAAGAEVTVVDSRRGEAVVGTLGERRVEGVLLGRTGGSGPVQTVFCDLLVVSGGWNPAIQLFAQSRGTIRFDPEINAYRPDRAIQATHAVGACSATFRLADCLVEGSRAGARAAAAAGFGDGHVDSIPVADDPPVGIIAATWFVPPPDPDAPNAWRTHFVDLERDVTVADLQTAVGAGLQSIEHIKRYTTTGTGSDQGKTSWTTASAIAADLLGLDAGALGMPTFRGPYVPVAFTLLAGRERGELYDPVRVTPMHSWHEAHGAVFENVGQWKRPRYYPLPEESMDEAVLRECSAARSGVGAVDVTTLGKIDIHGPDAGEFLNRVYANAFAKLPVGSCRYGVMCKLDGTVFDDGVTSRLADDRFHMTTTTGNAVAVFEHLEEWLQTEWPHLRVRCTSVTEQWAVAAVVGPKARAVVAALAPELDVGNDAFPFMTWRDAGVAGMDARVFRISFSGELAYEINVASWHGLALWEAVIAAGEAYRITPYGTEAIHVLRAEKGYPVIGQETDGSVTPQDLGLGWAVSKTKDFIGRRSHGLEALARPDRKQLVGLLPVDPDELLPEGAQLVDDPSVAPPVPMVGHVTSSYRSSALGRTFALGLVRKGRQRIGERVFAPLAGRTIEAVVADPVLYDPEGLRRDG